MTCHRYVYERMKMVSHRTIPPTETNKAVRYRDEHDDGCDGECQPVEMPWPDGETWPKPDKTTEQLAIEAFEARERYSHLGMMNVPADYEARKKQAVEYALAREELFKAEKALNERTGH